MISQYTSLLSQAQDLTGTIRTLYGDLMNAENIVINDAQRLFVTARQGVFELVRLPDGSCDKHPIPVDVDGLPGKYMKNGIAAHGNYLYLACAHVHQSDNPLVRTVLNDVNDVEQTSKGLLQLYMAAFTFRVESWIVRCDLTRTPLAFTQRIAHLPGDVNSIGRQAAGLTDNVMANGITIDAGGDFVYVANSAPGLGTGIYRVSTNPAGNNATAILWCRPPGCKPNGLKIRGDSLYYTGNGMAAAVLGGIPINNDGSAGDARVIDTVSMQTFDDFTVFEQGFVIAQFSDSMGLNAGTLRVVSQGGRQIGVLRRPEIFRPSAVAIANKKGPLFAAGELLIVDKHQGRIMAFDPDAAWRNCLRPSAAVV